jgi:altronate hydrolase
VAEGEALDAVGDRLLDLVLAAASGSPTKTELHGAREIAIFKDGVVL